MTCDRCAGARWVQVGADFAAKTAGPLVIPPDADDQTTARLVAAHDALLAAAADQWYPCRDCNPEAFKRWAQGHHQPGHDTASCPDCHTVHQSGPRRKSPGFVSHLERPELRERRDLA